MSNTLSFHGVFVKNILPVKVILVMAGIVTALAGISCMLFDFDFIPAASITLTPDHIPGLSYHLPYVLISLGMFTLLFSLMLTRNRLADYAGLDVLLLFIIFITLMFYSMSCQIRYLNNDEYEHLHNAWMMRQYTIPYYSLSFTHSPFLEWVISLFMMVQDESVLIIRTMRLFMFLLSCLSVFLVYRIADKVFGSHRHGLVCVLLIVCNHVWIRKSFEIRPDNIMIFFALLSFLMLIWFHETNKINYIIYFGICAVLSFLGKQNAAVFYFALGIIFVYRLICSQIPFSIKIMVPGILGLALFLIFVLVSPDILLNLGFNFLIPNRHKFWPANHLMQVMVLTPGIFALFAVQLILIPKLKIYRPVLNKYILSISITCLIFLFLMNRPWLQEMLIMVTFMALLGGNILICIMEKKRGTTMAFIMLLLIVVPPNRYIIKNHLLGRTMAEDLMITQTILNISEKDEQVLDAYGKAIFRHHPLEPKFLLYHPEDFSRLESLKRSDVKFLIKDRGYYPRLPEETLRWFDENFLPSGENRNIFIRKGF